MNLSTSEDKASAQDGKPQSQLSMAERLFELAGYKHMSATAFMISNDDVNTVVDRKIYIPLFINGYRTVGMLDSGAGLTLMSQSLFDRLGFPMKIMRTCEQTKLRSFSDTEIMINGEFCCILGGPWRTVLDTIE